MKMRATQSFAHGTKLGEAWIHGGQVLDESDPVVKAFPDLFEPVYETVSNPAPERGQQHVPSAETPPRPKAAPPPPPPASGAKRRRNG